MHPMHETGGPTPVRAQQYTIGAGIRAGPLSKVLAEIAQRHGPEKAHACRTVLSTYIITPLITGLNLTHPPGANGPNTPASATR